MQRKPSGGALVTGAGQRIGREIALRLGAMGYRVAVHYRASQIEAERVVEEIKNAGGEAAVIQADLSIEQETETLIPRATEKIGPLALVVNNASVFENDNLTTMTRQSWDKHIETNLRAPLKIIQDFAAQAKGESDHLAVNIIDQRVLKLTPQFLSYTVSKAALHTLTKTLAQALGPRGIRVNAIGPGPVLRNERQSEADWRRQNDATLLGRGATPEEICNALAYLINAHSVTGQMITVDGGQHLAWKTPDVMVKE